MAAAEVGDDVFGDDPTVNALQERAAELIGKEAGLFVASGTMGNLVAHMAHCARGGEIIADARSHLVPRRGRRPCRHQRGHGPTRGRRPRRPHGPRAIRGAMRMRRLHEPPITSLIAREHHPHGTAADRGLHPAVVAVAQSTACRSTSTAHASSTRSWRAHRVVLPRGPPDTATFCLSQGPGLPVGSMVVGSPDVRRAGTPRPEDGRRRDAAGRRGCGGGTGRAQDGTAGMVDRLADDHRNARRLAEGLAG